MKKVGSFAIIIISLIIIKNLVYSIYSLLQKEDLIKTARLELVKEENRNQDLKKGLKNAESQTFIESQARDKLLLAKPNEHDVLMSQSLIAKGSLTKKGESDIPNWQKWLNLFF